MEPASGEVSSQSRAPGEQAALTLAGTASVGPAVTASLFADYRRDFIAYSKSAMTKLNLVEKSFAVSPRIFCAWIFPCLLLSALGRLGNAGGWNLQPAARFGRLEALVLKAFPHVEAR